jgi:two-component system phosphate regulon response regulator OmpR
LAQCFRRRSEAGVNGREDGVNTDVRRAGTPEPHLLVVDDDDRLRGLLRTYLTRAGFRVSVAADAAGARKLLDALSFDLLVLDVMMPGEDGFSLTRWIRTRNATPILILTARGMPDDRIEGLSLGADDYLGKPFEPQELVLRIEAILRRAGKRQASRRLSLGTFAFDLERGELLDGDSPVRLTESEIRLLRRLAQNPDAPVDRYELADDPGDGGRAVDVQVTRLRRKIEPDPANPRYLKTVRGIGYMLAPD